jgi:hypothetical protein
MFFEINYPSSIQGILDIFRFFIERSIAIAKSNAFFANVLPDIILLKNYDSTRKLILDNLTLTKIDHWGMAFKNVNLDCCTILGIKKFCEPNHMVNAIIHENDKTTLNKIPQNQFIRLDGYKLNLHLKNDTMLLSTNWPIANRLAISLIRMKHSLGQYS